MLRHADHSSGKICSNLSGEEMTILDSSYYAPGGILNTYMHTQDVHESSLQEIFCSGSICLNKITGCFRKA